MVAKEKAQNGGGTLDQRIADALADASISRDALATLYEEVGEALKSARCTAETETASALDLSNVTPDESDALAAKAKRTIVRLEKALGAIMEKVSAIDEARYRELLAEEYEQLFAEEIAYAADLAQAYLPFLRKITIAYAKIDYLKARGAALNRRAPPGEHRRIGDPEVSARGIGHFDAMHPPLREKLRLPYWGESREIAFPEDQLAAISRQVAASNAAILHALESKTMSEPERRAEVEAHEKKERERNAESLAKYHNSLLEEDRRRLMGRALP